jgi:hypothetical protein
MVLTSLADINQCSLTNWKDGVVEKGKRQWRCRQKVDVVKVDAVK